MWNHEIELHMIKVGRSCSKTDIQNGCMLNRSLRLVFFDRWMTESDSAHLGLTGGYAVLFL